MADAVTSATTMPAVSAVAATTRSSPFEGVIDLETYPYSVSTEIKGDRSRTIFSSHGSPIDGDLIVDRKVGTLTSVFNYGRKYAVIDLATTKPKTTLVATASGRQSAVLGHACDVLNVVDGAMHREICLARDLPAFKMAIGPTSDGQGYDPSFGDGFPLRIEIFDASGAVVGKMEATRIEAKTIFPGDLEVPVQATKVTLADAG